MHFCHYGDWDNVAGTSVKVCFVRCVDLDSNILPRLLQSHGDSPAGEHAGIHYHSAMGFLNHNHEFEYLTSRVMFLQGLLHWLAAVALDVVIPKPREGAAARKMNQLHMLEFGGNHSHHCQFLQWSEYGVVLFCCLS